MTNYQPPFVPRGQVHKKLPWLHIFAYPIFGLISLVIGLIFGLAINSETPVSSTSDPSATPTRNTPVAKKPGPTKTKPKPVSIKISDGIYEVGTDIKPGRYKANSDNICYWARLSGLGGDLNDIITNHLGGGQQIVTIKKSDVAFESRRCGEWTKVG